MPSQFTIRRTVLLLTLSLLASTASAQPQSTRDLVVNKGERKLALVIGNDSYPSARLQNARNDARAVAAALKELGFTVTTIEDANRDQLEGAVARFGEALRPTDVAWFFYAGHGLQVSGENYLIPVDFTGTSQTSVRLSALPVTELQTAFSKAQVSVVVLDACRNNPFLATRGGAGGLAPIEARGSLVSFSTGAGQTASDNTEAGNGLFTQELLTVIREPGLSIRDMFYRVRQRVFEASSGLQFPAVYDGLVGNFVLRPAAETTSAPAVAENTQTPAVPLPATAKPTATAAAPHKKGGGTKWILLGVGGAGAAGAAVALSGGSEGAGTTPSNTQTSNTTSPAIIVKRGDYSGQGATAIPSVSSTGQSGTCSQSRNLLGTLTLNLEQRTDGSLTGTATTTTTVGVVSQSNCTGDNVGTAQRFDWTASVSGTAQNITFSSQVPFSATLTGGSLTGTRTLSFQGSLQSGVIVGTLRFEEVADGTRLGAPYSVRTSATAEVTLR